MTINNQYHVLTKVLSFGNGENYSEFIDHSHLGLLALRIACASFTTQYCYPTKDCTFLCYETPSHELYGIIIDESGFPIIETKQLLGTSFH